MYTFKQLRSKC